MGFDYVFDTNFTADLTIMEEGSEFIERFTHRNKYHWPMFTSCCPGWVRFVKSQFPAYIGNLSTAKSPQQMFGAVVKSYLADQLSVDPKKLFVVSIMPCTAKKAEAGLPTMRNAEGDPDVDVVLTTREIVRMFRGEQINPAVLSENAVRQPSGLRHRRSRGIRRHRRRHGRGSAQRLLSGNGEKPRSRRLPRRPRNGQLEGGEVHHPRRRRRARGGGQQSGCDPEADERHRRR